MYFKMENVGNCPMENYVIMNLIRDFVCCDLTLRSCRAVNNEWFRIFNEKASKKSVFRDWRNIVLPYPDGLGYCRLTHSFDGRFPQNNIYKLHLSNMRELLQNQNALDFFKEKGDQLKYLAFEDNECISSPQSFAYFQLLENVLFEWCKNLETVRLIGLFQSRLDITSINKQNRKLVLKNLILDYRSVECILPTVEVTFLERLFENALNLEHFSYIGYSHNFLLHYMPNNLIRFASFHCRNLSSLELTSIVIEQRAFEVLSSARWPLKKFLFKGIFGVGISSQNLNALLQSYKVSLEQLCLHVSWISSYFGQDVEIEVHEMTNLKQLNINVDQLNVGVTGQLGRIHNLRHLSLIVNDEYHGTQHELKTMFRDKRSSKLESLCLDAWYVDFLCQIHPIFPNIRKLELTCKSMRFAAIFSGLDMLVGQLEDLVINVRFPYGLNEWPEELLNGLSRYRLRVLKIIVQTTDRPWLRESWIDGFLNRNEEWMYSFLEFEGFKVRADEVNAIFRLLAGKVSFTKLAHCIVVDLSDLNFPRHLPLDGIDFFQYNVEYVVHDISRRLEEIM